MSAACHPSLEQRSAARPRLHRTALVRVAGEKLPEVGLRNPNLHQHHAAGSAAALLLSFEASWERRSVRLPIQQRALRSAAAGGGLLPALAERPWPASHRLGQGKQEQRHGQAKDLTRQGVKTLLATLPHSARTHR